jgi:hypothetical protein
MGSFSVWHWLVVLSALLLLFGGGRVRRLLLGEGAQRQRHGPGKAEFIALIFGVGALTGAIAALVNLVFGYGRSLPAAFEIVTAQSDAYLISFASSGSTWVAIAYALGRLPRPASLAGWAVRVFVVTLIASPISQAISIMLRMALLGAPAPTAAYLADSRNWFGFLQASPYNIVALVRSAILIVLIGVRQNWGFGAATGAFRQRAPGQVAVRIRSPAFFVAMQF